MIVCWDEKDYIDIWKFPSNTQKNIVLVLFVYISYRIFPINLFSKILINILNIEYVEKSYKSFNERSCKNVIKEWKLIFHNDKPRFIIEI